MGVVNTNLPDEAEILRHAQDGEAMPVVTCEDYLETIGDWRGRATRVPAISTAPKGVGPAMASPDAYEAFLLGSLAMFH